MIEYDAFTETSVKALLKRQKEISSLLGTGQGDTALLSELLHVTNQVMLFMFETESV